VLLEIKSFATRELYEIVIPRLKDEGFVSRGEYAWNDPDSDGEYGAMYFDYTGGEPLDPVEFGRLVAELKEIMESKGPPAEFNLVSESGLARHR
jgi:hypothetical protein